MCINVGTDFAGEKARIGNNVYRSPYVEEPLNSKIIKVA